MPVGDTVVDICFLGNRNTAQSRDGDVLVDIRSIVCYCFLHYFCDSENLSDAETGLKIMLCILSSNFIGHLSMHVFLLKMFLVVIDCVSGSRKETSVGNDIKRRFPVLCMVYFFSTKIIQLLIFQHVEPLKVNTRHPELITSY